MSEQPRKRPRFRRPAVQEELPLPPPPGPPLPVEPLALEWWQKPAAVVGLAALAVVLFALAIASYVQSRHDQDRAQLLAARVRTLTLRASTTERSLRIVPNPRSWSAAPDAEMHWPEPPELLDLHVPVAYSDYTTFALTIDKVDQGRMMIVQKMTPDSNKELRLSLNSSAFGPGEYRIRIEGYNWRGQRSGVGWIRLVVQ